MEVGKLHVGKEYEVGKFESFFELGQAIEVGLSITFSNSNRNCPTQNFLTQNSPSTFEPVSYNQGMMLKYNRCSMIICFGS